MFRFRFVLLLLSASFLMAGCVKEEPAQQPASASPSACCTDACPTDCCAGKSDATSPTGETPPCCVSDRATLLKGATSDGKPAAGEK